MSPYNNPSRARPIQAKHAVQDSPLATKYSCSLHAISYHATSPACPLCDADKRVHDLQRALADVTNRLEILHDENKRLRVQTDVVEAMREALDVTGPDDLLFLKEVLYQWKIDRSIALKVTHGSLLRKRSRAKLPPNGFIAMPRGADPRGHVCNSLGGLAIAGYFEEALNTVGSAQAMILLVRAMAKHLPGATE